MDITNICKSEYKGVMAVEIIFDDTSGGLNVAKWVEHIEKSEKQIFKKFSWDIEYLKMFGNDIRKGTCPKPESIKRLKATDDIWQLRIDDYRVFYFYYQDDIIVMTNVFCKKKNKTPSKEIKKAETLKLKY